MFSIMASNQSYHYHLSSFISSKRIAFHFIQTQQTEGLCCNFGGSGWYCEAMAKKATRPAIFKWRQTAPELILCAVRWYLRYSLSLRDVEELLTERGLRADHTTIWRWVQRYGPELEQR
jgi:hypothetical protein